MKDKRTFDQRMRDKLEEVHPPYSDASWDKIAPMIRPPSGGLPIVQTAKNLAIGAGTIAIMYLGYQLNKKTIEHKLLLNQNSTVVTVHDTLYINVPGEERIITKIVDRFIPSGPNQVLETNASGPATQPDGDNRHPEIKTTKANIADIRTNADISNRSGATIETNEKTASKASTGKLAEGFKEIEGIRTAGGKSEKGTDETESLRTAGGKLETTVDEIAGVRTEVGKVEQSDIVENATQPMASEQTVARTEPPARATVKTPKLRSQIGIYGMSLEHQKGLGMFGQIRLGRGFSLNTGAEVGVFEKLNFRDEDDYKLREAKEFRENLPFPALQSAKFKDIEVIRQFFQIPMFFQYDYDLPKNLSILISAGTKLVVKSKEKIEFETQATLLPQPNPYFKGDQSFNSPILDQKVFNNLVFNAGLSYQLSRFSIFAAPEYQYSFTKNRFLRNNIGIKIGTQLRLY